MVKSREMFKGFNDLPTPDSFMAPVTKEAMFTKFRNRDSILVEIDQIKRDMKEISPKTETYANMAARLRKLTEKDRIARS